MAGDPVLLDLNEESDSEEQDFEAWEPDPVDADPSKFFYLHCYTVGTCIPCVT